MHLPRCPPDRHRITAFTLPVVGCQLELRVLVTGEGGAASEDVITRHNVGIIVKCSGDRNGPRPRAYGTNARTGRPPSLVLFPVAHYPAVRQKTARIGAEATAACIANEAVLVPLQRRISP